MTLTNESQLLTCFRQYVEKGRDVKTPLLVRFNSLTESKLIFYSLLKTDGVLGIDGHPFKRGHRHATINGKVILISDHPELTEQYYPPINYDVEKTRFCVADIKSEDILSYCIEVVSLSKVPVICFFIKSGKTDPFPIPPVELVEFLPSIADSLADTSFIKRIRARISNELDVFLVYSNGGIVLNPEDKEGIICHCIDTLMGFLQTQTDKTINPYSIFMLDKGYSLAFLAKKVGSLNEMDLINVQASYFPIISTPIGKEFMRYLESVGEGDVFDDQK